MAYKEVRAALEGEEKSMLLLNRKGEQIVSIALPIRRFSDVQGVLLLSTRPGQIDKILREERIVILVLAGDRACWHRSSPRCCWRAPSPGPCAVYPPPPSASATTSTRARSYRNMRAAPTRWRKWRPPSTP